MPSDLKSAVKRCYVRCVLRRPLPIGLAPARESIPGARTLPLPHSADGATICLLSMDDLCPVPASECGVDRGGEPGRGVSRSIEDLLESYPCLRLTLFVVPDLRSGRPDEDNAVDAARNADWARYYRAWTARFGVEFAQHGLHHRQTRNRWFLRHAEFAFDRRDEARQALLDGAQRMEQAGFAVEGFRPPGWEIASDLSLLAELRAAGYAYVAASSLDGGLNAGVQRVSHYFPTSVNGLLNLPQNIGLDEPLEQMIEQALRARRRRGLISIKAHVADRGVANALTSRNLEKLRRFFDWWGDRHPGAVRCMTFGELAVALQSDTAERIGERSAGVSASGSGDLR
jgi:hypothetical protein